MPSPAIAVIAIGKIQYRRQKKDYRKQNPVFIRVQKRKNRKYHDQYTHYDMKHIQGKRDIRAFLSFFLQVQRIHSLLIYPFINIYGYTYHYGILYRMSASLSKKKSKKAAVPALHNHQPFLIPSFYNLEPLTPGYSAF